MMRMTLLALIALAAVSVGCSRVTPEEVSAVQKLARAGNVKELREMVEKKPALANAMVDDDCSLLEFMVDVLPAYPNTPQTVQVLLENGADPNYDAPEILRKAIWRGEPEVLELLLKHGADPTIVSPKKEMNMIDYARSTGDDRYEPIIRDWEMKSST